MTETALDIVTSAMRKTGILTKSESPDADEAQDALEVLNDILASSSNEGLMIYARTLESFTLSGGVAEYTIGTGGDFNTDRPVFIVSSYVRIGTTDYPLDVITDSDYADISQKNTNSIPYWINYTNAYPLAKIKFYPVPSDGWVFYLLSEKELTRFTLNQSVILPPGWGRYLKSQLALELAPEYGVQVPQETVQVAMSAKAQVMRGAARVKTMDNPTNSRGLRNIYTGWNY